MVENCKYVITWRCHALQIGYDAFIALVHSLTTAPTNTPLPCWLPAGMLESVHSCRRAFDNWAMHQKLTRETHSRHVRQAHAGCSDAGKVQANLAGHLAHTLDWLLLEIGRKQLNM